MRHRRWVAAGWVTVIVVVGVLAVALKGHTDDAFNVPGTQSQQALDLLNQKFPGTGGADARIVFAVAVAGGRLGLVHAGRDAVGDSGHENLPIGGRRISPLVATVSPHGWPRFLPTFLS